MVGLYVGASVVGRLDWIGDNAQTWGELSFRSMLVGTVPLLLAQRILGASRPNDDQPDSKWQFWNDDNGASGHAFVGAVPFLVAAEMSESPAARLGLTLASTLPAWSRIHDNDHYVSQVILGWWLARTAVRSVKPPRGDSQWDVVPLVSAEAIGAGIEIRR
jgi:hypothetical protein